MFWLVIGWTSVVLMGMGHLIVLFLLLFGRFGSAILAPLVATSAILDYILACILISCWSGQNLKNRWLSRLLYAFLFVKPALSGILSLTGLIVVLGEPQSTNKMILILLYVCNTFLVIIFPVLLLLLMCTRKPPKEKEGDLIPQSLQSTDASKEIFPGAGWAELPPQFMDYKHSRHYYQFRVDKADSV